MSARKLAFTLLAAVLVLGMLGLGHWQLGRADFKEALLARHAEALAAPPRALDTVIADLADGEAMLPAPVRFDARPAGLPVVLLDNQVRERRNGVSVLHVLGPYAGGAHVLVDYGWLPWSAGRELPAIEAPVAMDLEGLLAPWPGQGIALGDAPPPEGGRLLLARLDRAEIEQRLGVRLLDAVLRIDPAIEVGYPRSLDPLPGTLPPERHRGYAVQWFGLAAALAIITGVMLWITRRPRRRAPDA